jgi:hypothetical protein
VNRGGLKPPTRLNPETLCSWFFLHFYASCVSVFHGVWREIESINKALVLKALDTLFNKRDYAPAERLWSPDYIQHSAHIEPGRECLFNLVKSRPSTLKYEPGVIVADGDFVIVHGRFLGFGALTQWIASEILVARRNPHGALGCDPGRGNRGAVKEQAADVWPNRSPWFGQDGRSPESIPSGGRARLAL